MIRRLMPADIGSVDIVRCLPVLVRMFCLVPRLTHSLVTMASKGQTEKGDGAGKRMRGDKLVCACRWLSCAHCSWLWCVSCRLLAVVVGLQACIARGFGAFCAGFWLLSLIGMRASLVPLARFVQAFGCCRWLAGVHRSWLWCVSCRLLATVADWHACIARGFGAFRAGIWLLSLIGRRALLVALVHIVQAFGCCRWQAGVHCSWLWCISCRLLAAVAGRQACIARGFGAFCAGFWLL